MSAHHMEPLHFKFHWLDEDGNEEGFRRKKGVFDGEILFLDDVEIPAAAMTDVQFR